MGYAVLQALRPTGGPVVRQGYGKPSMQYMARAKRRAIKLGLAEDDSPEARKRREDEALARTLASEQRAESRRVAAEERQFARQKELLSMRQAQAGATALRKIEWCSD